MAASSSLQAARSSINKKRVEFADRRLFGETSSPEKQHISKPPVQQIPSDQELFDKLEEAYQAWKDSFINFIFKSLCLERISTTREN